MITKIRSLRESDLQFLFELLQEPDSQQRLLYIHYGDGNLLSWFQERRLEVLIAEINCKIIGSVAYNDGFWGEEIEWLVVCKTHDRKLVEDLLVEEAEKYVKKGTVYTSVNAESPKIEEWVQRGYGPNGGLYYMVTRLSGLKTTPKIPDGILLRSLRPEEENEFVQLVNIGFERERVRPGDVEKWKTTYPPFDEEWIHVAETNGKLVSVVVAKPDVGYNRFFNAKRGYLGPAATLPEYRDRNLASALTIRAMNFLFAQGMDSVSLYTLETNAPSIKLLRRIGFEIGHSWKFMFKHF
ncbi:MAG: GNAT family N-acetyltransferase [Candidatus Bathyarchaeia archaeon]|jgi:ribosomal protein S18 acetylase RimI-like enzyme